MDVSPVNPALAEAAVDNFLDDPDWKRKAAKDGWGLDRLDGLTLVARLEARPLRGVPTSFTLRVTCDYYPSHPPDVRFVNPETLQYDPGADLRHVANLQANYCWVHPNFGYWQKPYKYGPQLICSSVTLAYYFSGHAPTKDQLWDPDRHTVGTSIHTVHRALRSPHYHGRHG